MIRAISLDFWGTLAVFNPSYSAARTTYLANLFGVSEKDANARYKACKRKYDYSAEHFGEASTPLMAYRNLIEGQRLTRETNAVEIMHDLTAYARRFPPKLGKNIPDALKKASEHFVLCVTSNTNFIGGSVLRTVMADLPIQHFSFSDEMGRSKPDGDFFRTMIWEAQRINPLITPAQIIHIGDNETCDIKGASRLGMQTAFTTDPDHTAQLIIKAIGDRNR